MNSGLYCLLGDATRTEDDQVSVVSSVDTVALQYGTGQYSPARDGNEYGQHVEYPIPVCEDEAIVEYAGDTEQYAGE